MPANTAAAHDAPAGLWPALAAATRCLLPRCPFYLHGQRVGSVAPDHGPRLSELTPLLNATGMALRLEASAVRLDRISDISEISEISNTGRIGPNSAHRAAPADAATAALKALNAGLRTSGHILGWRDEMFAVPDPIALHSLASMERAATRFWGTLTFGAHATGFVRGADGRPSHLWIAQRSPCKATDPGLFDNLIGGGVPVGQTPQQTLVREAFEEAGLTPEQVQAAQAPKSPLASLAPLAPTISQAVQYPRAAGAIGPPAHSVLRVHRDVPHGLQHEWLYCFDVELPPGVQPCNQDGEVAGFTCLPLAEAVAVAAGPQMTVDAAVVTLDFLLRHGLLPAAQRQVLTPALQALRVG
jgi:8-oxo-dGTP pyrophosphatase MutT (NUDIX family)